MNAIFAALAGAALVFSAADAQSAAQGHGTVQGGAPNVQLPPAPMPPIGGPNHQEFPGQMPNRLRMNQNGEIESVGVNRRTFDNSHFGGGPNITRFDVPEHGASPTTAYHRRTAGEHLPPTEYGADRQITRYGLYGLTTPPPQTVWVRSGPDALLVNRTSGEIVRAQYGAFE